MRGGVGACVFVHNRTRGVSACVFVHKHTRGVSACIFVHKHTRGVSACVFVHKHTRGGSVRVFVHHHNGGMLDRISCHLARRVRRRVCQASVRACSLRVFVFCLRTATALCFSAAGRSPPRVRFSGTGQHAQHLIADTTVWFRAAGVAHLKVAFSRWKKRITVEKDTAQRRHSRDSAHAAPNSTPSDESAS